MILYYFKIGSIMSKYLNSQNIHEVNWEASRLDLTSLLDLTFQCVQDS